MKTRFTSLSISLLFMFVAPSSHAQGNVRVDADGTFSPDLVHTLRNLTEAALRSESARTSKGVSYVLRVGRLGQKIPMSLDEVRADGSVPYSAGLAAMAIEEADVVIPRLVAAVVGRKPVTATASMETVVEVETRELKKKASEQRWAFGAPISPGGFSVMVMRQTPRFRVDLMLEGTGKFGESGSGAGFFGAGGAWFLSEKSSVSPYIAAGAGIVWVDDIEGTGGRVEIGIEVLRLHRMRLTAGIDAIIPGFDPRKNNRFTDARRVYPALQLRVGF